MSYKERVFINNGWVNDYLLDDTIKEQIDTATSKNEAQDIAIDLVNIDLESEIENRTNADTELKELIETNTTNIETEVTDRQNADTELEGKINDLTTALESVTSEGITDLQSDIKTNAANIETLQSDLTTEANTRSATDSSLQSQITSNASDISDLKSADTTLQNSIDTLELASGNKLDLSLNPTTYELTISLLNSSNQELDSKTVDFPLESVVVSGSYDSTNKKVILTLKDGSTLEFSIEDLIDGLVSQSDFDTLESTVTTNTTNISNNTKAITTNTSNISTNTSNIASLTTRVTTTESKINNLESDVAENTSSISTINNNLITNASLSSNTLTLTRSAGNFTVSNIENTSNKATSIVASSTNYPTNTAVINYVSSQLSNYTTTTDLEDKYQTKLTIDTEVSEKSTNPVTSQAIYDFVLANSGGSSSGSSSDFATYDDTTNYYQINGNTSTNYAVLFKNPDTVYIGSNETSLATYIQQYTSMSSGSSSNTVLYVLGIINTNSAVSLSDLAAPTGDEAFKSYNEGQYVITNCKDDSGNEVGPSIISYSESNGWSYLGSLQEETYWFVNASYVASASTMEFTTADSASYAYNGLTNKLEVLVTTDTLSTTLDNYQTISNLSSSISSSETNYPSNSAVISYVSNQLSNYSTTSTISSTYEKLSNKTTSFTTSSDTVYPTTGAVITYLSSQLSSYVTSSTLNTTLGSYAKTDDLSSYVTNSSLTTTLGDYALTSSLNDYVKSSDLTTTLNDYVLNSSLNSYAKTSDVSSTYQTLSNLSTSSTYEADTGSDTKYVSVAAMEAYVQAAIAAAFAITYYEVNIYDGVTNSDFADEESYVPRYTLTYVDENGETQTLNNADDKDVRTIQANSLNIEMSYLGYSGGLNGYLTITITNDNGDSEKYKLTEKGQSITIDLTSDTTIVFGMYIPTADDATTDGTTAEIE